MFSVEMLRVACLLIKVATRQLFFLLARQPSGDDEVEIRCLHSCLSRTMSVASFMFSCKRFKSSCILLIHSCSCIKVTYVYVAAVVQEGKG